jgi:hypothetical protein
MNVFINGFGRIGRSVLRAWALGAAPGVQVVGINDIAAPEMCAYLFEFDSVFGPWHGTVALEGGALVVNGRAIPLATAPEPSVTTLRPAATPPFVRARAPESPRVELLLPCASPKCANLKRAIPRSASRLQFSASPRSARLKPENQSHPSANLSSASRRLHGATPHRSAAAHRPAVALAVPKRLTHENLHHPGPAHRG